MAYPYKTEEKINAFITAALSEDIQAGDHSSLGSIHHNRTNKANLLIKGKGILAGVDLAKHIFKAVDANLMVKTYLHDGDLVKAGDIGFSVEGSAISILSAERLVLNCMQRMSGIATYTNFLQSKINHTKAKVLDTRKTTPNFRLAEKWAVEIGGGKNHRFGLFDMIMLKDNHIDFAGGISLAVENVRNYLEHKKLDLRIEVETRNLAEVKEALANQVDVIMLDNMAPEEMKQAVTIINGACETEASGGITEDSIVEVAECGVDYISVGALTHSVKSMDISLKAAD